MLEYINTGTTNDVATESLDDEVKEARLKEEWRAEYMLTLVHDKDVYRDGFDQGSFDMALANIKNAINSFNLTFDEVCDKLGIEDKEKYRDYIN